LHISSPVGTFIVTLVVLYVNINPFLFFLVFNFLKKHRLVAKKSRGAKFLLFLSKRLPKNKKAETANRYGLHFLLMAEV